MKLKNLYNFLDGYTFVDFTEVYLAVLQYMQEELWIEDPDYYNCTQAGELAERYAAYKNIQVNE